MVVHSINGVPAAPGDLASAHSIQAFIEIVYCRTANQILVQHMASLEQSLGISQQAMSLLTQVQNMHNEVTTAPPTSSPFPANETNSDAYKANLSKWFGGPVVIVPNVTGGANGMSAFTTSMANLKAQISALLPKLQSITPLLPNGSEDANSLQAKLSAVLNDINNTGATLNVGGQDQFKGAFDWLIDGNNTASSSNTSAGKIQQNITNAITAGQSLNTTQTEAVRNFLYLFEEYYKSASAVLTAISQAIQKMAGNIAR